MFSIIADGRAAPAAPPRNRRKTDRIAPPATLVAEDVSRRAPARIEADEPGEPVQAVRAQSGRPTFAVNLESGGGRNFAGLRTTAVH